MLSLTLSRCIFSPGVKPFSSIILGRAQDRKIYYKKLISLVEKYRLTQIIKFIPFCKEMPLAYKLADVVVSASIEPEAFGRVSVEAVLGSREQGSGPAAREHSRPQAGAGR